MRMRALLVVGDDFEDLELFTVTGILRRAKIAVTIASLSSMNVTSSSSVKISADKRLGDIDTGEYELLLLPSFDGMENSNKLVGIIKEFNDASKIIAAMSRAPLVLAKAGVIENRIATVYTGLESKIPRPRDARIVIDGNIITSRAPSDAAELSYRIVELVHGKAVAKALRQKMTG